MEEAKALVLPGALAFGGVMLSQLIGSQSTIVNVLAGVAGAMLGLAVAKRI
jgi:hypothetical protein